MIVAPDHIVQLNTIDDILDSVQNLSDALHMASADSCFGGARNVVQTIADVMNDKVATVRELLNEVKGRLS